MRHSGAPASTPALSTVGLWPMAKVLLLILAFAATTFAGSKDSFNHASAKHKTLNCNQCHKLTVEKSEVTRFPGHAACASCHNFSDEGLKRPDKFCGI